MNTKMKLLLAIIALILGVVACSDDPSPVASGNDIPETVLANAKPELGNFGIDLSQQDPNTKPGDDFFRFANGKWLEWHIKTREERKVPPRGATIEQLEEQMSQERT